MTITDVRRAPFKCWASTTTEDLKVALVVLQRVHDDDGNLDNLAGAWFLDQTLADLEAELLYRSTICAHDNCGNVGQFFFVGANQIDSFVLGRESSDLYCEDHFEEHRPERMSS